MLRKFVHFIFLFGLLVFVLIKYVYVDFILV